jgi:hypothetical protein
VQSRETGVCFGPAILLVVMLGRVIIDSARDVPRSDRVGSGIDQLTLQAMPKLLDPTPLSVPVRF